MVAIDAIELTLAVLEIWLQFVGNSHCLLKDTETDCWEKIIPSDFSPRFIWCHLCINILWFGKLRWGGGSSARGRSLGSNIFGWSLQGSLQVFMKNFLMVLYRVAEEVGWTWGVWTRRRQRLCCLIFATSMSSENETRILWLAFPIGTGRSLPLLTNPSQYACYSFSQCVQIILPAPKKSCTVKLLGALFV